MRVVIGTVQVPFVRGGAELLAEGLRDALRVRGHEADIVTIPFKWYPAEKILDHMLAARLLDVTSSNGADVDWFIGLKFPAYFMEHERKSVWLVHQHRTAYEMWDHPYGDLRPAPAGVSVREAIRRADALALRQVERMYTIAGRVSQRLAATCGITAPPLYSPPHEAERFSWQPPEEYFFFPSRLTPVKRQDLVLEALSLTEEPVRVSFAGLPDAASYAEDLASTAARLGVADRVEWLGFVDEDRKRELYSRCLAVIYPPIDEDYGYITLEAMLSGKAVVTCTDSGGPLEFVGDRATGRVTVPAAQPLASALDQLWRERSQAEDLGRAGRERYDALSISWDNVVDHLLPCA